ncbi:MAG: 4-(cytidine 5'-diphospho)-2-C-methyl-D-erythritol kinase [Clostridia bacterium]|nr:4-(cytidine 5'-diphospho)-2-C-methyl-D-erythritol kinase [Clostridia bacterium]
MRMMNTVKLNAYAKLNLTLDIVGEKDGYHMLDSLAVTVDIFDRVVIKKRKDSLVSVTMHGMGSESIPPEENNAQRAGEAFVARFGTQGADITIYKNIPIGAGLGGSSADAAAVIAGMGRLFSVSDATSLKDLADSLGSDTGYLLSGGLVRMRGRGEIVEPLPFRRLHLLILAPKGSVLTAACYREYDRMRAEKGARTEQAVQQMKNNPAMAARFFGNDLFPAAKALNPDVGVALAELESFSPLGASMTGSGSAAFALFETRELVEWAKSRYRGKFRPIATKSIDPKEKRTLKSPFALAEGEGE